eukprot:CAMPEP_0119144772 /NCGR_PEP_ID=MMETSP1310-20130426/36418_1 /TAXON_ID=464262 /ORGANISM="Genus nov. species nov., Strain RCC2339" /LENGTH=102 /DNA_ID=CAMNT_0007136545 /DNA_START=75 /DNA_END=380 /DNA_ORIENTATION=-
MDGKQVVKTGLVREDYPFDSRHNGKQRLALKGAKKRDIFICEGQTLSINGKLIEIGMQIDENEYLSGNIFLQFGSGGKRLLDKMSDKARPKAKPMLAAARLR